MSFDSSTHPYRDEIINYLASLDPNDSIRISACEKYPFLVEILDNKEA
jgi:hypothetical protein